MTAEPALGKHSAVWMEKSACLDREDLFIYDTSHREVLEYVVPIALRVCKTCPVLAECKKWAEAVSVEFRWTSVVVAGQFYKSMREQAITKRKIDNGL